MFCAVLCTTVVHNEQFFKMSCLGLVFVPLFRFSILCVILAIFSCIVCFFVC